MLLSAKSTYAIRVICDMAENEDINEYVSISTLSDRLDISKKYLESIMTLLSKNNIVDVCRGKNGGYKLNKKPEEYKLIDILKVTEDSLAPVACVKDPNNECSNCNACPGYKTWLELNQLINDYFGNKTIKDLMCK
mgnify:CR=1 FL=1